MDLERKISKDFGGWHSKRLKIEKTRSMRGIRTGDFGKQDFGQHEDFGQRHSKRKNLSIGRMRTEEFAHHEEFEPERSGVRVRTGEQNEAGLQR